MAKVYSCNVPDTPKPTEAPPPLTFRTSRGKRIITQEEWNEVMEHNREMRKIKRSIELKEAREQAGDISHE
jgi:hypothetical protein